MVKEGNGPGKFPGMVGRSLTAKYIKSKVSQFRMNENKRI
jgi:hypothetical protein